MFGYCSAHVWEFINFGGRPSVDIPTLSFVICIFGGSCASLGPLISPEVPPEKGQAHEIPYQQQPLVQWINQMANQQINIS